MPRKKLRSKDVAAQQGFFMINLDSALLLSDSDLVLNLFCFLFLDADFFTVSGFFLNPLAHLYCLTPPCSGSFSSSSELLYEVFEKDSSFILCNMLQLP